MERVSTKFLWRVSSLGSVGGTLVGGIGRELICIEGGIGVQELMESSSDGIMWGGGGF